MATYEWRGIDASGKAAHGVREAESPKALRLLLRRDRVWATEVLDESSAKEKKARELDLFRVFRRVTLFDLAMATRQLSTLLRAGIPLVEALGALIDQIEKQELKAVLTQTRDRVNEGTSLADALKLNPKIFSTLYVSMVAAGEASGTLDTVLSRVADFLEAQSRLRSKVIAAAAYPTLMASFGTLILSIIVVYLVPKVTAIYEGFNRSLPLDTRLLIGLSNLLIGWWWALGLVVAGCVWMFRRWLSTPAGRLRWDQMLLTAPLIGRLVTMISVSRFSRTLGTLLGSGVPVLQALSITRNVVANAELMKVIDDARSSIREGESISVPLQRSGRFPPIVVHMIAIGERSGQLEQMLEHVSSAYDQQVEARLTTLTSLLEPILIIVIGGLAGLVVMAVLRPLVQLSGFVQ